ncbi:MAG TPA: T9SS type A sorting domain-containing protein [bacterium]|jgi:hypothetical protein
MNRRFFLSLLAAALLATAALGQMTVVSSVPENGAVGVATASTVSFTFSEPLDTSRHIGDEGLCVSFLAHDPQDSMSLAGVSYSADLRTMSLDLVHTANTDFLWLVELAWSATGDLLSMPYPLCYTTAASLGEFAVSGAVSMEGGGSPVGAVMGLMDVSPFGEHGTLLAGTVISTVGGSYTASFVRPGTYYPISALDGNHDGSMDGEMDLIGYYDPDHTGTPQAITVTDASLPSVDMVLMHLNHWITAHESLDTVRAMAAEFGSDFQLMTIRSNSDSVGIDGRARGWSYIFFSPERQRCLSLNVESGRISPDTAQNNQFPPNMLTLPLDYLDSDTIMAIAEENGGAEIRTQHNIQQISLMAGNLQWFLPQNPNAIVWVAEYSWHAQDSLWESWRVALDIHTGEVVVPNAVRPAPAVTAEGFALLPNFPNPFNPSTTVPFVLPKSAHVDLKVYDVVGREVATLVNGTLPAGAHSARFEANHLPNGIYFCRLHAGPQMLTRKVLLLK